MNELFEYEKFNRLMFLMFSATFLCALNVQLQQNEISMILGYFGLLIMCFLFSMILIIKLINIWKGH